jgi:hypothetical protein
MIPHTPAHTHIADTKRQRGTSPDDGSRSSREYMGISCHTSRQLQIVSDATFSDHASEPRPRQGEGNVGWGRASTRGGCECGKMVAGGPTAVACWQHAADITPKGSDYAIFTFAIGHGSGHDYLMHLTRAPSCRRCGLRSDRRRAALPTRLRRADNPIYSGAGRGRRKPASFAFGVLTWRRGRRHRRSAGSAP